MKYLLPLFIAGILGLLLIGQIYTVYGQAVPTATRIVINEVDIDPPGDDSKLPLQWVELYNPTNNPVNVGGWSLRATTGLKHTYTIAPGTTIPSQQFLVYTYGPLWFPHAGATIQLKSPDGIIVDQTPPLSDQQGNTFTWQRLYDGYDTSSQSDWVFKIGTLGYSNGKPATTTISNTITMSITTDKTDYTFGDTAIISGQVSKLLVNPAITSIPMSVNLSLLGSTGFHKTFTLYPGNDMKFSTTVKLDQVLGFDDGIYTITGSYGDTKSSSSFSLASKALVVPPPVGPTKLLISTDNLYYEISQPIVLSGNVSKVIPLTPVKYKVYDPTDTVVYTGTIFPDSDGKLTTINPYQRSTGNSGLLINSVHPIYGIYRIDATYADASALATFTLLPTDVQTDVIVISSDKKAYAPGETVIISGSTNLKGLQNVGLNPSLQIIQTTVGGSSGTQTSGNRGIVPNVINLRTIVNLQSDNTFTYKFDLPGISDSFGNYRIIASLSHGIAEADFVVVENPSDYKPIILSPFSIVTDKNSYALGDHMIISGRILNPINLATQNAGTSVKIQLFNSTGAPITSGGSFINNIGVSTSNALTYSAFPDANGNYQVEQTIQTGIYLPGNYTLSASYNNLVASTKINVHNPQTGSQGEIIASTDKKVYGVGDLVHLDGRISSLTGTSSYTLILTSPTGNQITFPLTLNNGVFSWSWTIPKTANLGIGSIITTDRSSSPVIDPTMGVYGIYRIKISSTDTSSELFFQVSKNPQQNQDLSPIVVQTDKTEYLSTDVAKIWGQVIPLQNDATKEANAVVQVLIYSDNGQQVYRGNANVNQGGQYFVTIPFHTGIWKTGSYKLYAQYSKNKVITTFKVIDPFTTSSTKLQLFITTDNEQYLPGQTVLITGRTSFIVSIDGVDLAIGLKNDVSIIEGEIMSKKGSILPKATVPFDQFGSFSYNYKIPNNAAIGNYTIVTLLPFGANYAYFDVVNKLPIQNNTITTNQTQVNPPNNQTQTPITTIIPYTIGPTPKHTISTNMIVEKINRIYDSVIPIPFSEQFIDNMTYYPRQLDGLLRINPGNENDIGIKISSQTGTCILGPDPACLVTKSTVQSGKLYQTVAIDGMNFLVGYSGTGGRLQQFSIVPSNSNNIIPEGQWNVDIIKKDQVTRFYYQVTYQPK